MSRGAAIDVGTSTRGKTTFTAKQKCAIFLIAMGPEITSEIFKHLKDNEVEDLTFEIAKVAKVEPEEKEKVLREFHELLQAQSFITTGGVDFAKGVLEKLYGPGKAGDILNRFANSVQARPFDFVRRTDPSQLLNFIQGEHPQTIALILAYLDPQKAAQILGALPQEIRADVAKRVATMDRTAPEILREVERVLERKLSALASEDFTEAGGVDAIVEVLNSVDRTTEKSIIESLEEEDPELAEEIKKRMFVFEDIVLLDDRAIQKVLRDVDMSDLAKALKGVEQEVQDKIFRNMSKRAGALLREDMEYMGPIRLKDVEEAQSKIVNIIRKLEEQGDIVIARGDDSDVLV